MKQPKILLNKEDFDALHLSSLVHGGIGQGRMWADDAVWDVPLCKNGHAIWIEKISMFAIGDTLSSRLYNAGLTSLHQDSVLQEAGVRIQERVDFETYCKLLNIDVKED